MHILGIELITCQQLLPSKSFGMLIHRSGVLKFKH